MMLLFSLYTLLVLFLGVLLGVAYAARSLRSQEKVDW